MVEPSEALPSHCQSPAQSGTADIVVATSLPRFLIVRTKGLFQDGSVPQVLDRIRPMERVKQINPRMLITRDMSAYACFSWGLLGIPK